MWNPWMDEAQAGIKIAGKNINNLRYADDTTLVAESEEELKSLFFFFFYFILLYNTVLVLPYIDMNPPQVYMRSQTWTPLPTPSP